MISTEIASRFSSYLNLNLNTLFLISVATLSVRIILTLTTFLNCDILLILFYLCEIAWFILLNRGAVQISRDRMQSNLRPIYGTEDFGQWNMSSLTSVE